jgi:hypothetical protein
MQLAVSTPMRAATTTPRRTSVRAVAAAAAPNKNNNGAPIGGALAVGAAAAALLVAAAGPALAGDLMFDGSSASSAAPAVQGIEVAAVKAAAAAAAAAPKAAATAAAAASSSGLFDSVSDNPGTVAGLAAAGLGLPAGLIALLRRGPKTAPGAKPTSAAAAVEALEADARTTVVDIRSREAVKQYGSPALPKGRRSVSVPFTKVRTRGMG